MSEYCKIQTVYHRDMESHGRLIEGKWSLPEFEYLANNPWEWTEKIDGTNIRIIIGQAGSVALGGKTDNAQLPAHLVARLRELFDSKAALLAEYPIGTVLYGEGYGLKIQKGGDYLPDRCDFILFDVRIDQWWLRRDDVYSIATKLGIDHVPVIGSGTLLAAIDWARSEQPSRIGTAKAEGLVMRPVCELLARSGNRIIAKIKHRDFVNRIQPRVSEMSLRESGMIGGEECPIVEIKKP